MMGTMIDIRMDSGNRRNACPVWFPAVTDRTQFQVGVVNRYGLKALTETFLQWQQPLGSGTIQGAVVSVGDVVYRTSVFQLGMNKPLGKDWCIGMNVGFSQVRVNGYGNRGSPQIAFSLAGLLDDRTMVGCRWENPQAWMGSKFFSSYASTRIRFGLARALSERLDFMGCFDWERATVPGIFLQVHYRPNAKWRIDLGWGRTPDQVVLGVERVFFKGVLRTSFLHDPVLDASCLVSYSYSKPPKKNVR